MTAQAYKPTDADLAALSEIDHIEEVWVKGTGDIRNLRLVIGDLCKAFAGIHEIGKSNKGFWVSRFNRDIGMRSIPWCLAYDQWVIKKGCKILGIPDVLPYNTPSTQSIFVNAKKIGTAFYDPRKAQCGDLIVWQNISRAANNVKYKGKGHVGFVIKSFNSATQSTDILLLTSEGNTNKRGARDGGSVRFNEHSVLTIGTPGEVLDYQKTRYVRGFIDLEKQFNLYNKAA